VLDSQKPHGHLNSRWYWVDGSYQKINDSWHGHNIELLHKSNSLDVEMFDEKVPHIDHRKREATAEVDSWRIQVTEHVNTYGRSIPKKQRRGHAHASYFRCLEVNLCSAMKDRTFQCWLKIVSDVEGVIGAIIHGSLKSQDASYVFHREPHVAPSPSPAPLDDGSDI
jgi:hypothetical protein